MAGRTPGPLMRTRPAAARGDEARLRAAGMAAAGLTMASWGFAAVLVKLIAMPDLVLTFHRAWMGLLVMLVVLVGARRRLTWRMLRASAAGGLFYAVQVGLFFAALKRTSVADVMLIGALQPVLVLFVAGRWFGEAVTRWKVAWTLASLAGVAIVVLGSVGTPVWSLEGDLLAVAALVTFTGYWLASKRVGDRREVAPVEYMTAVMLITTVFITPIALLSGQDVASGGLADWVWLGVFVLFPGAGAHLLMAWAHRYVDVSVSSLMIVGVPVISVVAAWLVLDEPLNALTVIGSIVVVVAIAAFLRPPGRRAARGAEDLEPGPVG